MVAGRTVSSRRDQAAHVYVGCLVRIPGRTTTRLPPQETPRRGARGGVSDVVQGNPERGAGLYGERSRTGRMTMLDDASPGSSWRPILSGTTAQQALQAVDAIAESITS